MLNIVSVESPSKRVHDDLYGELSAQLSKDCSSTIASDGIVYRHWLHHGVIVLEEQSVRFPWKELLSWIERHIRASLMVWTRIPLNESALRKLRKMSEEGSLQFSCYLVSPKDERDPLPGPTELERIIKISQNRPLGAEWISEESIPRFIHQVTSSRFGLIYPIEKLPKVTSVDVESSTETPLSRLMRRHYSDMKGREVLWYPKKYVHKAMDEEKWGVKPLPKFKQGSMKRHVLVTGTGRSGTTYFSDLLTLLGLDVGHQRNGTDGCSGAEFAIDSDWYPWFPVYGGGDCANVGERRSDYDYKHVLHIVRHPLWCIPSLMKNYPAINPEFWADNGVMDPVVMDGSSIVRNAAMYYGINKRIDDSGQAEYRCQLEQIHDRWDAIMDVLEMSGTPDPSLKASNQASGWGQYEPLTWTELEDQVGGRLARAIKQQAISYGYA